MQRNLEGIDKLMYAVFGVFDDEMPLAFWPRFARRAGTQRLKETIDEILTTLTHREQTVLELRFGLRDSRSLTLEEVGRICGLEFAFGVSKERIRQIEQNAVRKLRHHSRSRKIKIFYPAGQKLRVAIARRDLYLKLSTLYPRQVALTVALRGKSRDLRRSLQSTEVALKSSCGQNISSCLFCQKPLPPGWNFCDIHCKRRWQIIPLVCDKCGEWFERPARLLFVRKDGEKRSMQKVFCCNACRDARGKGAFFYHRRGKRIEEADNKAL